MRRPQNVGRVTGKFPRFFVCLNRTLFYLCPKLGNAEVQNIREIMSNNDCFKKVGEPKTFGFELVGSQIQFCLHRGTEWQDCYLLIKLGDEVKEIRLGVREDFTDDAIKKLFCSLFTLVEDKITIKPVKLRYLDDKLHECLKKKGEEV